MSSHFDQSEMTEATEVGFFQAHLRTESKVQIDFDQSHNESDHKQQIDANEDVQE